MGQSRAERTWPRPRSTRHVWVRLKAKHPLEPPVQGLVIAWRRRSYQWQALVIVIDASGEEPVAIQLWLPADRMRPVRTDPNTIFGNR